jgi:uncharacterized protein (TIGR03435 family)
MLHGKPMLVILIVCGLLPNISPMCSQEVKIGEPFPQITFENVINYNCPELSITDFKGKLIILEFWSTNCISCIQGFPKLDSLQKVFGNKLQIILVNQESKDFTERFFAARKKIKKPALPFITSDVILSEKFPHSGNPYCVWIDTSGIILYKTDGFYVKEKIISKILKGEDPGIKNWEDIIYAESLFDPRWDKLLEYYSFISRCRLELNLGPDLNPVYNNKQYSRISAGCYTIQDLYKVAFDGLTGNKYMFYRRPVLMFLEVKDSSRYINPFKDADSYNTTVESNEWVEQNTYTYQILLPEDKKDKMYKTMKEDLDLYFDVTVEMYKRKTKCLVLVRTSKKNKLRTRGGEEKYIIPNREINSTSQDSIWGFRNIPYKKGLARLSALIEFNFKKPFIDSTGLDGNIDFLLPGEMTETTNINEFKKELKKYDLNLVERDVVIDVLVLKENRR